MRAQFHQIESLRFLSKWLVLSIVIGTLAGSASAFFLHALHLAEDVRNDTNWLYLLLPVGGLIIGLIYHYFGSDVVKGNNQILEEFHSPKKIIPLKMAPLVLFGTVATHFFGGSAGREGTAVQMGGAIADQFTKWFKLSIDDRKIILIIGISAGFASVFGTPLAGAIFALEVLVIGKVRYEAILPSLLTAIVADQVCLLWGAGHASYIIPFVPEMNFANLGYSVISGILMGWVAWSFSKSHHVLTRIFKKWISYPPLRPVVGGIILVGIFTIPETSRYMGLGVPYIQDAFQNPAPEFAFGIKLLLTAFTLAAGFKGGEVTPLFYIGATLGNVLILVLPLPMALLAGMGFVGVFAGATNTPIACTIMAIELFGAEGTVYFAIACVTAYLFSGKSSIYTSQILGIEKSTAHKNETGKTLEQ